MTDLSIIIVTYKGWNRLDLCLSSLKAFSGERFSKEVIVVDNTPDQNEISEVKSKYPGFTFIHNIINGGYGYAVNIGVEHCTGRYILVLNPDTVAGETAVLSLVEAAEKHPEYPIISCRQVNEKGKECNVMSSFPGFRNLTGLMRSFTGKKAFPSEGNFIFPDWVSGSVLLMRNETFRKLNGFDDDYWMYFEDVDLCKRASLLGNVALLNDTVIEHNHGGSSRVNPETTALTKTEVHISRHVYISKHKKGPERSGIQLFLILNNLVTNLIAAIPGLILFFIPSLRIRTLIFAKLVAYYLGSAANGSWISPRSVNYRKNRQTTG